MKTKFNVGDLVCVSDAPDATIYEIVEILPNGFACFIREQGLVDGKPYREQRFDTSLLLKKK